MDQFRQKIRDGYSLVFVHIPKCGGTFANLILRRLGIKCIGHHPYTNKSHREIVFATIRDPIDRYESMLNYKIQNGHIPTRADGWIQTMFADSRYSLDDIVEQMTDVEMLSFRPFHTIEYYSTNVDFFIPIPQLLPMLEYFGFDISHMNPIPRNVSIKNRGTLSDKNRSRIASLYPEDVALYQKWKHQSFYYTFEHLKRRF